MKNRVKLKKKYIVVREGREVFCGDFGEYCFKPILEIGGSKMNVYPNEKKAKKAFMEARGLTEWDSKYQVIPIRQAV